MHVSRKTFQIRPPLRVNYTLYNDVGVEQGFRSRSATATISRESADPNGQRNCGWLLCFEGLAYLIMMLDLL